MINLTICAKELLEATGKVSKTLPKSSQVPVLNLLKLTVTPNSLIVTAMDLANATEVSIPSSEGILTVEGSGSILVPRVFMDMVKKLGKEICISIDGTDVKLKSANPKIKTFVQLVGQDAEEYPTIPSTKGKPTLVLKTDEFVTMLNKTTLSASRSENTPLLMGVHFQITDKKFSLSATDRFRLSQTRKAVETIEELGNGCTVPAIALEHLAKNIKDIDEIKLFISEEWFVAEAVNFKFCSKLLNGTYPDLSKIIPTDSRKAAASFIADRQELIDALDRIWTMKASGGGSTASVASLHVKTDTGVLCLEQKQSEVGKVFEEIFVADSVGKSMVFNLNTEYAIQALQSIVTKRVRIDIYGEIAPVTIMPEEEGHEVQLVLPVRVTQAATAS